MSNLSCGFQTFEHTADIGISAWGTELKALFVEAARGLFSVMVELSHVHGKEKIRVSVTAENEEELLLKWLKELLFLFDTKRLVFSEFKIRQLEPTLLDAEVIGEVLDSEKHTLGREVKAITYHQFKLTKERARWTANIILDI